MSTAISNMETAIALAESELEPPKLVAPILRSLTEAAEDACHLCGQGEYMDVAGMSREVSECRKCERPICGECAEVDYDMVGDPPYYRCTQWQCPTDCEVSPVERIV